MNYLLLIHGYTQSGEVITKKVKKILGANFLQNFNIIAFDGIYNIGENITNTSNTKGFGWWELKSPEMYSQKHTYENYEKAVEHVRSNLEHLQPDDTLYILSFSQGAVLTEIMLVHNLFPTNVKPEKVLLLSPSGILDDRLRLRSKVHVDSNIMVMFGENEGVYSSNYTQLSCIENVKVHIHSQGHVIPSNSLEKGIIRDFFK